MALANSKALAHERMVGLARLRVYLIALAAVVTAHAASGQVARIVADLNQDALRVDSGPINVYATDSLVVVEARTPATGLGLWIVGTDDAAPRPAPGTVITTPGISEPTFLDRQRWLAALGSEYLFCQRSAIWRSDGTPAGTHQLLDSVGGAVPCFDRFDTVLEVAGTLYFAADSALWRTDGTSAGTTRFSGVTVPVDDIQAVFDGHIYFVPARFNDDALWRVPLTGGPMALAAPLTSARVLCPLGDRLLVSGRASGGTSVALYSVRSSSTLLTPILLDNVSAQSPDLSLCDSANGRAYVSAYFGNQQYSTFVTDGTLGSAQVVLDARVTSAFAVLDTLYFYNSSTADVWRSDGSAAGTSHVLNLVDSELGHSSFSTAFWPTASGLTVQTQLGLFAIDRQGNDPVALVTGDIDRIVTDQNNEALFFAATDQTGTAQIWRSDGTLETTRPLTVFTSSDFDESIPGPTLSVLRLLDNDGLYFVASFADIGVEAAVIRDLNAGNVQKLNIAHDDSNGNANPSALAASDDQLLFAALSPNSGTTLYATRGRPGDATTVANFASPGSPLADGSTPPNIQDTTWLNGRAVFNYGIPAAGELWATDGTPGATHMLSATFMSEPLVFNRAILWNGFNGGPGIDPNTWTTLFGRTDATVSSAEVLLQNTNPFRQWPLAKYFETFNGHVYFAVGRTLFRSDGSAAGTEAVFTPPNSAGVWAYITLAGSSSSDLYFTAVSSGVTDCGICLQLWRMDRDGNFSIMTDAQGANYYARTRGWSPMIYRPITPPHAAAAGDALVLELFHSTEPGLGARLAVAPGGTDELIFLEDPDTFGTLTDVRSLKAHAGLVYFGAQSQANGHELWVTDGTVAGTRIAAELAAGSDSSFPSSITVHQDRIHFVAKRPDESAQIYRLDDDGAVALTAFDAPNRYGIPSKLTSTPNNLYFSANDGVHGRELWVLASSTLTLDAPAEVTTGQSIELTWESFETDGCTASGDWSGARAVQGTETVGPVSGDLNLTLSCDGPGGAVQKSVQVRALAAPPPVTPPPPAPSSGGGATGLPGLVILCVVMLRRRCRVQNASRARRVRAI